MATPTLLYLYDEASSGTTPTLVHDTSSGTAADATINYGGSGSWTSIGAGRGLSLPGVASNGAVTGSLSGTKVQTALGAGKTATLVIVADFSTLAAGATQATGLVNSGSGDQGCAIEVTSTAIRGYWNAAQVATYTLSNALRVYHWVIDTTQATAANRFAMYQDGVALTDNGNTPPAQNTNIDASSGGSWANWVMMMGHYDGVSGMNGKIYFSALYNVALSAAQVAAQATALLTNNDADPDAGTGLGPVLPLSPAVQAMQARRAIRIEFTIPPAMGVFSGTGFPPVERAVVAARRLPPPPFAVMPPAAFAPPPPPPEAPRQIEASARLPPPPFAVMPPQIGVFTGSGFPPAEVMIRPPPRLFVIPPDQAAPAVAAVAAPPPPEAPRAVAARSRQVQQTGDVLPLTTQPPPAPLPAQKAAVRVLPVGFGTAPTFPPPIVPPPPPPAPFVVRAFQRIVRWIFEVGWPRTVTPPNAKVTPPLVTLVDNVDLTIVDTSGTPLTIFATDVDSTIQGDT